MFHRTTSVFAASLNMAYYSWLTFQFQRQNHNDDANSPHSILIFLTSLLLNFLLLKFQCLNTTPFQTHPKTTYLSVLTFLGYVLARAALLRLSSWLRYRPAYAYVVERFVLTFGSLAAVSLASLLSPDRSRPVLYLLCVVLLAGEPVFLAYKAIMEYQVRRRRMCAFQALFLSLPRIMALRRRAQRQLEILPTQMQRH